MIVNYENKRGFSLFAVVSALFVLSALTISITAQILTPASVATSASQQILRENNFRSALQALRPIVSLASVTGTQANTNLPTPDGSAFEVSIDGRAMSFILQDVNGLLDINSASQDLLSAFLAGIGKQAQLEAILQRRANAPFASVEEFALSLGVSDTRNLGHLLTINSGRRRINGQTAPLALLRVLAGQQGSRAQLVSLIDKRFLHTRPVTLVLVTPERFAP